MICGSMHHLAEDHVETGLKTKKRSWKDIQSDSERSSGGPPDKKSKGDGYNIKLSDGSQVCLSFNRLGRNKDKGCSKSDSECRHKYVCANCRSPGHIAKDCKKPAANRMHAGRD